MQGKNASKMSLGFAFAVLLTLQSLQLVSTQSSNRSNVKLNPLHANVIPDEWKREHDELGMSQDSIIHSGDEDYQVENQTELNRYVTGYYDANENTTPSPETTPSNTITTMINKTNNENKTSIPFTTDIWDLEHSSTQSILTDTNITNSGPGNSTTTAKPDNTTTPAFNATDSSTTSTIKRNRTTTSPPKVTNDTPSDNSTTTTILTTTRENVSRVNETIAPPTTQINETWGSFNVRDNLNGGQSSDIQLQTKTQAWGAILGIGVGVAIVALVVYIIVKRRNYRDFSHRKLEEDLPPGPVLRLDNSEPLEFKFDGGAYYNPSLQGDNIQMTNFPQGRTH